MSSSRRYSAAAALEKIFALSDNKSEGSSGESIEGETETADKHLTTFEENEDRYFALLPLGGVDVEGSIEQPVGGTTVIGKDGTKWNRMDIEIVQQTGRFQKQNVLKS